MNTIEFTVDIYGSTYRVLIESDKKRYKQISGFNENELENNLGFHRYKDSLIAVNATEGIDTRCVIDTFIHECVHAIYNSLGYGQEGKKFDDEFLCNFIASHIVLLSSLRKQLTDVLLDLGVIN